MKPGCTIIVYTGKVIAEHADGNQQTIALRQATMMVVRERPAISQGRSLAQQAHEGWRWTQRLAFCSTDNQPKKAGHEEMCSVTLSIAKTAFWLRYSSHLFSPLIL